MPDHAIARINDGPTREAIMLLRTEIFQHLESANASNETTARVLGELSITVQSQERATLQWQESGSRFLTKMDTRFGEHEQRDDKRFDAMKNWLIGVLCAMVGSSWGAIAFMFWTKH